MAKPATQKRSLPSNALRTQKVAFTVGQADAVRELQGDNPGMSWAAAVRFALNAGLRQLGYPKAVAGKIEPAASAAVTRAA